MAERNREERARTREGAGRAAGTELRAPSCGRNQRHSKPAAMGTSGVLAGQREEARHKKKLGRGDPRTQRAEDQIKLGPTRGLGATSHGAWGQALSGWSRETAARAQRTGKKTHERESGEQAARAERKKETRIDKGTRGGGWIFLGTRPEEKKNLDSGDGIFSFGDFSFIFFVFRISQIFLTPDFSEKWIE
jgi:hypothetical protein